MGKDADNGGIPYNQVFFSENDVIRNSFTKVFNDTRPPIKGYCRAYQQFARSYGLTHTIVSMGDSNVIQIERIRRMYLLDFLTLLTYQTDRAYAEKSQDEFDDNKRKQKRK